MEPPRPSPSPSPETDQSLHSRRLQEEFFRERRRRFCEDDGDDSSPSAPLSPASSSPRSSPGPSARSSPGPGSGSAQSWSSPELLAELKSRSEPLRPVSRPKGLTTVFSGRGSERRASANQEPPPHQQPITADHRHAQEEL